MCFNKTIVPIILSLLVLSCDTKENLLPRDAEVFVKYYGGSFDEEGTSIVNTGDGGTMLLGSTTSTTNGNNRDIFLVKVDERGVIQFEKTFGGDGDDYGVKIIKLASGNFIIAANQYNGANYDMVFIEINNQGNKIREIVYDDGYDELVDDIALSNQFLFIVGTASGLDANSVVTTNRVVLRRLYLDLSSWGFVPDQQQKLGTDAKAYVGDKKVISFQGGKIYVVSNTSTGSVNEVSVQYWEYDPSPSSSNNLINATEINDELNSVADKVVGNGLTLTRNGDVVFLTTKFSPNKQTINVVRYDVSDVDNGTPNGVKLWSKEIVFPQNVEAVSIYEQSDNNIVISATASISATNTDIVIVKLDQSGNQVFSNPMYFGGLQDDVAGEIIEDAKGNLLFTGTITFENKLKATLIKTNSSGKLQVD